MSQENDRIKNLHPMLRVAYKILQQASKDILDGNCDADEVADTLMVLNPRKKGYKREDDYVTFDKGMKMLGLGQNRAKFNELMKKNGILNEKFNTIHIGFNRQKVLALKYKNEHEYQERLKRIDKKKKK